MSALNDRDLRRREQPEDAAVEGAAERAETWAIRSVLSDEDREHAFHAYFDEGHIDREEAKLLLGSSELQTAEENARGAEQLFEGDTSRFF